MPVLLAQQAAFDNGLGQLLEEQWHAVGAGEDLPEDLGRQRLAAGGALDQRHAVAAAEAGERQHRDVGVGGPGRGELRPRGDEEQQWQRRCPRHGQGQQLERGRVDPVRVLEQHQHRLPRRKPPQLRQQRLERLLLAPLRREVRETVFVAGPDRHPLGDEADLLGAGARSGEQRFELGQPRFRPVLAAEARGVLELGDEGMERARLMVRRAEIAQPRVWLACRLLEYRLGKTRFADAGFANQHHHPALAGLGLLPAALQ